MRENGEKAIHIIRRTLGNHTNFLHIVPADWETSLWSLSSLISRSNLMKDHKKFAWFLLDHFHIIFLTFFFLTLKVKGLNKGTKRLVVICLISFTIFSWPFKPFTSSFTRLTWFTIIAFSALPGKATLNTLHWVHANRFYCPQFPGKNYPGKNWLSGADD